MVNSLLNNPSIPKYLPHAALGLTGLAAAAAYAGGPTALVVAGLALAAIAVVVRYVIPWQKLEPFTLEVRGYFPIRWEIKTGGVTISLEAEKPLYDKVQPYFNRSQAKEDWWEGRSIFDAGFFKKGLLDHEKFDGTQKKPILERNERVIVIPPDNKVGRDNPEFTKTFKAIREFIEQGFFSKNDKIRLLYFFDMSEESMTRHKKTLHNAEMRDEKGSHQLRISRIQKDIEKGLQQKFTFSVALP